jgi:uracil-DNA glycosylase family 4
VSASAAPWDALATRIRGCVACPELVAARTTVVVGDRPTLGVVGDAPTSGVVGDRPTSGARLALVGEAPGAQEDLEGRPFVGRAGTLLDQLLGEAGIRREDIAVLNTLKCRPPRNRAPKAGELNRCRGWLEAQLEIVHPELVLALGSTAVGWFHGRGARIAALRGEVIERNGLAVLATYHPSAALRFGPRGAPMAALREDLALTARLLK